MRTEDFVIQFNECINRGDLAGLGALMTDDHVFTDSVGAEVRGKADCLEAWRGFFRQFPDYRNTFMQVTPQGDRVVVVGFSTCETAELDGPAIWTAAIHDNKVAHWRVYQDTPEVRAEVLHHA
jgi:ketosteroid isomerase-like protein